MTHSLDIDEILYHKLVNFYTENLQLPPLAAKICAYLIFDFEAQGLTFEDLVETLKASKSSVSCSLQLLLQSKHITVLNKIDERKRYFIINPDYAKIRFETLITKLQREYDIIDGLKTFKKSRATTESDEVYINKLEIHGDLLKNHIITFSETIKKLYQ